MPPFGLLLCFARGSRIFARFVAARPDRFGMEECAHESIGQESTRPSTAAFVDRCCGEGMTHASPLPRMRGGASRILYCALTSTGIMTPFADSLPGRHLKFRRSVPYAGSMTT